MAHSKQNLPTTRCEFIMIHDATFILGGFFFSFYNILNRDFSSGANGKLIDQLSDKARELMAMAGSAFSCVAQKFIQGDITIKILNQILEREDAFTELLQIGNHLNLSDTNNSVLCILAHFNVTSKILVKVFTVLQF